MMADGNRLDLSGDIDKISTEFLDHVETAAAEVKQQLEAAAEKKRKEEQATRSRKITAAAIAVGAVLVLLVSYILVFARPDQNTAASSRIRTSAPPARIADPTAAPPKNAPPQPRPAAPQRRYSPGTGDSQLTDAPPNDYEQPGQDDGM